MASLCFFRWPGAYAEAPFDTLFDTLLLLCMTCPGAVGCCAMAGAPVNAAKAPITARCLIIGHSFLCAPPITLAESQGFRRRRFSGRCLDSAGSVPLRWPSRFCSGSRVEHRTDKPELSDVFSAPCRGVAGHIFCEAWKTCQTLSLEALLHLDEENSHDCG